MSKKPLTYPSGLEPMISTVTQTRFTDSTTSPSEGRSENEAVERIC